MVRVEDTLAHLARMDEERAKAAAARARALLARLPEAVRIVRARGARRVFLFGSLAEGAPTEHSDVDLAVEGLAPGSYFEALADLMKTFGGPVDLVRLEEAPPGLRDRILEEGRSL